MYIWYIYIYVWYCMVFLHASDDGHKKVFPDVPMIGFKIEKKLKGTLGKVAITRFEWGRKVQTVWRKKTSLSFMWKYERHVHF